jgi:hypothetical protein
MDGIMVQKMWAYFRLLLVAGLSGVGDTHAGNHAPVSAPTLTAVTQAAPSFLTAPTLVAVTASTPTFLSAPLLLWMTSGTPPYYPCKPPMIAATQP